MHHIFLKEGFSYTQISGLHYMQLMVFATPPMLKTDYKLYNHYKLTACCIQGSSPKHISASSRKEKKSSQLKAEAFIYFIYSPDL